jgi:dTDP-4-amino-4,6-dideoxygalactose transaminase
LRVPFNKPYLTGNELTYIERLIRSDDTLAGDGTYTKKVCRLIESRFGARKAFATTSCTSALELATRLLRLKSGDEVIVPSFTFTSTANPVLLAGARVVFAEIREDSLNIDPEDIARKINKNTRAIYPVHYGGVACDMDAIMDIAREHGLAVVEDAAQALNAKYKDRYLGTIGHFGCLSFHETKNCGCGEGGALLINSDDSKLVERTEIIREKGTDRSRLFRGEVDKYCWMDVGSSHLPSDILMAFLYAQLEQVDAISAKRMAIYDRYHEALLPLENEGLIRLPIVPSYAEHNAHIFYIVFRNRTARDTAMHRLKERGVSALFHYIPLHSSPMGRRLGYREDDLPVTEDLSGRLLRLPIYAGMTEIEMDYVISAVTEVVNGLQAQLGRGLLMEAM